VERLEQLPARLDALTEEVSTLRRETREGFSFLSAKADDLHTHMLVLHEKVVSDLAIIKEGL